MPYCLSFALATAALPSLAHSFVHIVKHDEDEKFSGGEKNVL